MKRCVNTVSNDKLLSSILNNNANIFEEVRKLRKKKSSLSSQIDNLVDPNQIAEHFSGIYEELFNNIKKDPKSDLVEEKLQTELNHSSFSSLENVSEDTVRSAVEALKSDKRDSIFNVTSDMYKSSPDEFYKHMTNILKGSLVHGKLPDVVLLCSLMPLVKDNLGGITKSKNYRAIAGGCLILKVLDLVILQLEGDKLSTDALQFAYKQNSGTAACTWMVTSVIDYFTRNGKTVFGASMDMSKAFDMVKWSELFTTLLERRVNPSFIKLLLYIYKNQQYTV